MAASFALQGALTALAAALIASVLQVALVPVFPLEVTVPDRAFWQIPVIAVLVSLVAGGVGLRKAVSTDPALARSEEHTSELQSLMRISYAVFCLKKKTQTKNTLHYS